MHPPTHPPNQRRYAENEAPHTCSRSRSSISCCRFLFLCISSDPPLTASAPRRTFDGNPGRPPASLPAPNSPDDIIVILPRPPLSPPSGNSAAPPDPPVPPPAAGLLLLPRAMLRLFPDESVAR